MLYHSLKGTEHLLFDTHGGGGAQKTMLYAHLRAIFSLE